MPGVNPLDTPEEIADLVGRRFCVVVYDDVEVEDGTAELDDDREGVTALEVTGIVLPGGDNDDDDGDLPSITVHALDLPEICAALGANISDGVAAGDPDNGDDQEQDEDDQEDQDDDDD